MRSRACGSSSAGRSVRARGEPRAFSRAEARSATRATFADALLATLAGSNRKLPALLLLLLLLRRLPRCRGRDLLAPNLSRPTHRTVNLGQGLLVRGAFASVVVTFRVRVSPSGDDKLSGTLVLLRLIHFDFVASRRALARMCLLVVRRGPSRNPHRPPGGGR